MKSCESWEIELSSLIDGELAPEAATAAVEHALGCAECAEFFRAARRLGATVETLRAADGALSHRRADQLWRTVAERASAPAAIARVERALPSRSLRAAALVALGLGGGWLLAALGGPGAGGSLPTLLDPRLTSSSASSPASAAMDERRFVALADELMRSDVRYQRAMLEVLRLVPALESGEGLRNEDRPRVVRAATESTREAGAI
jgi:hypothetical protein